MLCQHLLTTVIFFFFLCHLISALISNTASEVIRCRLNNPETQALGHWLFKFRNPASKHSPYFVIRKPLDSASTRKLRLSDETLRSMTKSGEFSLQFNSAVDHETVLDIMLCLEDRNPKREYMISGFPRTINNERNIGNYPN